MNNFDSNFVSTSSDNNNDSSLRKKIIVAGAIALLFGVVSYSGGTTTTTSSSSLLRSNQGTENLICKKIISVAQTTITELEAELKKADQPFVLDEDKSFTRKNVKLDTKGCVGDITMTLDQGAEASGFGATSLELDEMSCSAGLSSFTGKWEVKASDASSTFAVAATVSAKSTNCDIDSTESIKISLTDPTFAAVVSLRASFTGTIKSLSVEKVVGTFEQAETYFGPGTGKDYPSTEADVITDMVNTEVLPKLNTFIATKLPFEING